MIMKFGANENKFFADDRVYIDPALISEVKESEKEEKEKIQAELSKPGSGRFGKESIN